MKALQKFIHLTLSVAIILASMGFRVDFSHCAGGQDSAVSLYANPGCCCSQAAKTPAKSCPDIACVLQQGVFYQSNSIAATQQAAKVLKIPANYPSFSAAIRPAILQKTPHFTLPPPISGRIIGILNQSFII